MPEDSVEEQRLEFDREKIEFKKSQNLQDSHSIFKRFGGAIPSVVALLGVLFTGTQILTTCLTNTRELELAQLNKTSELELARVQNDAEEERLWRIAISDFISKHKTQLFSDEKEEREEVIAMMEATFPQQYADPVIHKVSIVKTRQLVFVKEQVVTRLLKPLVNELNKTKAAFDSLLVGAKDPRSEMEEIREGNVKAHDILVRNTSLIPDSLRKDALRLVEHYDAWLAAYNNVRRDDRDAVVFVGARGFPFPKESEQRFRDVLKEY